MMNRRRGRSHLRMMHAGPLSLRTEPKVSPMTVLRRLHALPQHHPVRRRPRHRRQWSWVRMWSGSKRSPPSQCPRKGWAVNSSCRECNPATKWRSEHVFLSWRGVSLQVACNSEQMLWKFLKWGRCMMRREAFRLQRLIGPFCDSCSRGISDSMLAEGDGKMLFLRAPHFRGIDVFFSIPSISFAKKILFQGPNCPTRFRKI